MVPSINNQILSPALEVVTIVIKFEKKNPEWVTKFLIKVLAHHIKLEFFSEDLIIVGRPKLPDF